MEKEMRIINGCDVGSLAKGKSAIVFYGGRVLQTGPVVSYAVCGGRVVVETENTLYCSR